MDEERLILLVSEYSELYDLSHKNYSNLDRKNNCWTEIGKALGQPGMLFQSKMFYSKQKYIKLQKVIDIFNIGF